MSVKIGHASIDERGRVKNGSAGDSTGREVCIRTWYSKPWDMVLRPVDREVAEKSARYCEKVCSKNLTGYDQNQRNTHHTNAKAVGYDADKLTKKDETDCSAFMTVCAIAGGVKELEYTGNAPTTRTMEKAFTSTGKYKVLKDKKILSSDTYLKRGDILLKKGSHTVMVLENGCKAETTDKAAGNGSYGYNDFFEECKDILGLPVDASAEMVLNRTVTVSARINKNHKLVTAWERLFKALGYYNGAIEADKGKTPCFGTGMTAAMKLFQKNVVKATPRNQDGIATVKGAAWKKALGL